MKLFILITLLLGISHKANSSETTSRRLTIATYDAEPWVIHKKHGLQGVSPQFAKLVELVSDYHITVKPMPYSRMLIGGKSSNIDIITSFYHPELLAHSRQLTTGGRVKAILVTTGEEQEYLGDQKNRKLNIGILRGIKPAMAALIPAWWNLVDINSEEHGLRAVHQGRLDATIMTDVVYQYMSNKNDEYKLLNAFFIDYVNLYIWVKKDRIHSEKFQHYKKLIERISLNGKLVIRWWAIDELLDIFHGNP